MLEPRVDAVATIQAGGQSPGEPLFIRPALVVRTEDLLAPTVGQDARPAALP
jgi:hypothetical protein